MIKKIEPRVVDMPEGRCFCCTGKFKDDQALVIPKYGTREVPICLNCVSAIAEFKPKEQDPNTYSWP